jgi:rhodanese-related sulfurtransferase
MSMQQNLPDPKRAEQYFANKTEFTAGPMDLKTMIREGRVNVIDVRAAQDFAKGHVPGSKNLPEDKWDNMSSLDRGMTNVLVCYSQTCHLAARAARKFAAAGFPVMELEGGFEAWKDFGMEIAKGRVSENEAILT